MDRLDGVQVVQARVQADLVEHSDARFLDLGLERADGVRDVRGGEHVDLVLDRRLDHVGVVDVGDERNHEVLASDRVAKRLLVVDVERNVLHTRVAVKQLRLVVLRRNRHAELGRAQQVLKRRARDVARAEQQHLLRVILLRARLAVARGDHGAGRRRTVLDHLARELGQDKRGTVHVLVVVAALGHVAQRRTHVAARLERADYETDLAARVGRNRGEGVVGHREELLGRLGQLGNQLQVDPHALGLRRDVAARLERLLEQRKVGLLEQHLGGAVGVRRVGDDHVERRLVLGVVQERKAVADDHRRLGVVETDGHVGQVLARHARHRLVNVAQHGLLDQLVLDDFAQHTTVAAANDQHALRVRVRVDREMRNHLLVRELVTLRALDGTVEHEHVAVRLRLEDEHVLVLALLRVQNAAHLEAHRLSGPLRADLVEPAIADAGVGKHFGASHRVRSSLRVTRRNFVHRANT